jgi:hypothetical protein
MGCQIVPIPCKPCYALVGQLLRGMIVLYKKLTCPIYPWGSNPTCDFICGCIR